MDVSIRQATAEDTGFLAWAMLESGRSHVGRGIWDLLISGPERERLAFLEQLALADTVSFCHYSTFLVAEANGQLVSTLCGYDAAKAGTPALIEAVAEVGQKRGWRDVEREQASQRVSPYLSCSPEEPPATWIIENVATIAERRRQGVARLLLEEILERGRRNGYKQAQISLLIGNSSAQRAYEALGFTVTDEKRHPDFEAALRCPGIVRLARDL